MDLIRITPRDTNYTGKHNFLTILRPELVLRYCEYLKQQEISEKRAQLKQKQQQASQTPPVPTNPQPGKEEEEEAPQEDQSNKDKTDNSAAPPAPSPEEEQLNQELSLINYSLNPTVFCDFNLKGSKEEIEKEEKMVTEAAKLLVEMVIPGLVSWSIDIDIE